MAAMRRHLLAAIAAASAVTLLASCSAASAPSPKTAAKPAAATATTPPVTATSAAPTRSARPAGSPPKKGTLAWYIYELPTFAAPPAPAKITLLPATGPAKQFDQVPVANQKVAFITIDDGWEKDPGVAAMLKAAHIPFTMFLTSDAIKSDPSFFKTLQIYGGVIEDHTITHPKLTQKSYVQQRHEICQNRTTLTNLYGRAPVIMRAPYGLSNKDTLKAAASCGIRANVFWDEYAITGTVTWQRPGGIHPGDMVLMHFDKYLKANLLSALQAFHKNGITPALLEDYLVTALPAG
jgi:peptidoglycan/xylan/chitin deacetylase (PgdA/CDA1 family)